MSDKRYKSTKAPESKIIKDSFVSRLSSLFGFHIANNEKSDFSKKYGIDFVTVDLNNPQYKVQNAMLGSVFDNKKLSTTLEVLFDKYLTEFSNLYDDTSDRQARIKELYFMYCNDGFVSRAVELTADEATQLDAQDRLLSLESTNANFIKQSYKLFSQWGITQTLIRSTCRDIELYGEAFWVLKVTQNGIMKVKAIHPSMILERLEFSPIHVSTILTQRDGMTELNKNRLQKLATLVDTIDEGDVFDFGEDLADMFDTKLLGFELSGSVDGNSLVVPPWTIVHFRFNPDASEFFPYGRPPLLNCLAPFKQCQSAKILQGIARAMSFPITLYKVKGTEGFGPDVAFEHVNNVREEYDNIGVTPSSAGNEVYTVNTKLWVPADLLDVEVKESKVEIDSVDDINLYEDNVAIASGVPKAYLDQEFGGFGNSGISLTEQYKPFARHVYSIQSIFLAELANLIRLHYAITGEFSYDVPFTLGMRFPASEMGEEQRNAKTASLELAKQIVDDIKSALGVDDETGLPESVILDIYDKYSFLDATDFQRWFSDIAVLKSVKGSKEEEGGDSGEGDDFGGDDFGGDEGGSDEGGDEGFGDFSDIEESKKSKEKRLREKKVRFKEIEQRYFESKDELFFKFLEKNNINEFRSKEKGEHYVTALQLPEGSELLNKIKMVKRFQEEKMIGKQRLKEEFNPLKESDEPEEITKLNNRVSNKIKDIVNGL